MTDSTIERVLQLFNRQSGSQTSGAVSRDITSGGVSFQAVGKTSTSTGTATVTVQVSNDNTNWLTLGTISLTTSTSDTTDGFAATGDWAYYRATLATTGTYNSPAGINLYMAN